MTLNLPAAPAAAVSYFLVEEIIPLGGNPTRRPVDSLFRRLAVEVFIIGFRVVTGMVDDAVPMIRRRIERVELQWNIALILLSFGRICHNYSLIC